MSRKLFTSIDKVVNDINNLNKDQLSSIDLDYLKCKRRGKNLFIIGIFDIIFMARLREIFKPLSSIDYPNRVFKAVGVIVIDLISNRYLHHRLFSFPNNLDLYNKNRIISNLYMEILKKFEENPLKFSVMMDFSFSSGRFKVTKPTNPLSSHVYTVRGKIKVEMNFDIDEFVNNTIDTDHGYIEFDNGYFRRPPLTKQAIIEGVECTCYENEEEVPYTCKCDSKSMCNELFHVKKCKCGKFTYFRTNTCFKCYLQYGKSKRNIDNVFDSRGNFINDRDSGATHRSISSYIPYFHYNQDSGGICLGDGSSAISNMMEKNINPIKIMLSFKANLAYTDVSETISYYNSCKDRITNRSFSNNEEYLIYLNMLFGKITHHIFSIYCYCPQCLFYKIMMLKGNIKINTRGFEVNEGYLISRDRFIEIYRKHLETSRTYYKSDIHAQIKKVVNTPPRDQLIEE